MFFVAKDGKALSSQQKQGLELTVAQIEILIGKFRLKLNKVGKTTKPFSYYINQIPYDYSVEVTNRFKGLDLIAECQKNSEFKWAYLSFSFAFHFSSFHSYL